MIQPVYPTFIRAEKTEDLRFILWNTGNYQYQIEVYNRGKRKVISKIDFNSTYEEVSDYLDELIGRKQVA